MRQAAKRGVARVFIGLGSNLDQPESQVQRAIGELDRLKHTHCIAHSSLYRSKPLGPANQPDYVNAAAELETGLTPEALLAELQAIEVSHGREGGGPRWGPRPLDLDILLYADQRIETPRLRVPHPRLAERAFVLVPLAEIAGDLDIPGLGRLSDLLAACPAEGLERLDEEA